MFRRRPGPRRNIDLRKGRGPEARDIGSSSTFIWQRLFCLVVKTWTYLSTNIDRQIDTFSKITCHFPGLFFLQKVLPTFFGHSLLSCVIPRPLSYHPYHMMTSYDTASICQSMLVENDVRMGVLFSRNKEWSKSIREGLAKN